MVWDGIMLFWSKLASVYNHCCGFVSLLIKRAPPSVWFLQESIKRPIRCCVSQGTDPRSAVRQRQTLCWGLSYAGVKNQSCQHGVNSLSGQFSWLHVGKFKHVHYWRARGVSENERRTDLRLLYCTWVWILPKLLHFYPFKTRKLRRSCDWQGFSRSLAWD